MNSSVRTLFIDSRNHVTTDFFTYTVKLESSSTDNGNGSTVFPGGYRNVQAVKLKCFDFPKILNENYVVLDIEDFRDNLDSTNEISHQATSILHFEKSSQQVGESKPNCEADMDISFNPPLPKLSQLRISFKSFNGEIISSDLGVTELNKDNTKHNLTFEIVCKNGYTY